MKKRLSVLPGRVCLKNAFPGGLTTAINGRAMNGRAMNGRVVHGRAMNGRAMNG